jgi:pimeloyl-ACP methyl ester carboxylesterase
MQTHNFFAAGHRLAATTWGRIDSAQPTIVMLHGGLDCTSTWKDLPEAIAAATGLTVLSYDRYGYGRSEQLVSVRGREYRHEEAGPVFADLLGYFGIRRAVLFGHSDGGAIAVLAAAKHPVAVQGVCVCVPTVAIDLCMVQGMDRAEAAFESGDLRMRLARHHGDNTETMFRGWRRPWCDPEAVHWSMAEEIAAVKCPVSALFGRDDEYGWRASASALFEHGTMALELIALPGVGHHPHHRARGEVLNMLQGLLRRASSTAHATSPQPSSPLLRETESRGIPP